MSITTFLNPKAIRSVKWSSGSNLNNFTEFGVYQINGNRNSDDNMPILNTGGYISAMLYVTTTPDDCVSQQLTLLNAGGGDTNVYIRTRQNGTWKPWGKLQTNVEVNAIGLQQSKTFDDFIDNGMYSGVNIYWEDYSTYTTGAETFVLIVINDYMFGAGITQLKYSIRTNGMSIIEKRIGERTSESDSDGDGISWSEWGDIKCIDEIEKNYSSGSTQTVNVYPNNYYIFKNMGNLTINLNENLQGTSGKFKNFMFEVRFNGGNTLNISDSIKWGGNTPEICKDGGVYQISIINDLGLITEFK